MNIYVKILTDVIVYGIVTAFTFLLVFDKISAIRPYKRGFFCDDDSIKYPLVEESISDTMIIVIAFLVFPAVVILVEIVYAISNGNMRDICGTIRAYFKNLYRTVGSYLFGGSCTILVVECLKLFFGRLRPNFFAVCKPNMTVIDCTQGFVADIQCGEPDPEVVADLRKSFPSGHAATAAYGMLFLAVYLQFRLLLKWVRLFRPFLQTLVFILGVYICASRLQDYRHHPGDVIAGAIVGAIGCLLTFIFLADKMHYMDRNYLLRKQNENERTMQMGNFKGVDNQGFRDSGVSINMTEISTDINGSGKSKGAALP